MSSPETTGPPPECPAHNGGSGLTPLYGDILAGDTPSLYRRLREEHGSVAPVELEPGIPAWLVLGYREVLEVTRNETVFSHDPRHWRAVQDGRLRPDSPLAPMMAYRPTLLFTDGPVHARFSRAVTDSLAMINLHDLRRLVTDIADQLIDRVAPQGHADLMIDFAARLPLWVVTRLLGLSDEQAPELITAVRALADSGEGAKEANQKLQQMFTELLQQRAQRPGDDLPSWLLAHPSGLSPEEVLHHIMVIIVAGTGPAANWTANAARLLMLDSGFRSHLSGGRLTVDAALDEVLWRDTPVQNFPGRYALQDLYLGGRFIQAGDALILGLAAANQDPAVLPASGRPITGNRSHVSFGAGPHTCPARNPARVIAHTAVSTLINRLPDMQIAVDPESLTYRTSPWSRALYSLPVNFTPSQPSSFGART
ncbi:cytochrome P450 [Streptomyces sp. NPDC005438]|uniref:cytochrome P450 n=1 Tax=Streptomyces sp. NPDC005438 TaxID=3156880 RepID=UPI0033A18D65